MLTTATPSDMIALMSSQSMPRLGRGLSSLIAPTQSHPDTAGSLHIADPTQLSARHTLVRDVQLDLIDPNPAQPRRTFDPARMESLAQSMRQNGALQPILVRAKGDRYEIIAGERRWRAAKIAGLSAIPAIIRPMADTDALQIALIENIQRENLNPVERARAYSELHRRGLSPDEIGQRMSEDRTTVTNYLRILDLDDKTLELVAEGRLSMGHARCLLGVAPADERIRLARRMANEGWSVRQAESHVQKTRQEKSSKPAAAARPVISDLASRLSTTLGLRVRILESRRRHSGRVIIDYHSLDDFERLLQRLGVRADG